MRQSSIAVPSGATLRPTRCTRPSRFVTVPAFSPHSVTGRNTSARFVDSGVEAVDRDDRVDRVDARAAASVGVGEVADRVGAEEHEHVDLAVGRGAAGSLGVEARARPAPRPSVGEPVAARVEGRRGPGRKPGARPASSAPCTLPRRSADRKRTSWTARELGRGAHRRPTRPIAASVARPTTTTTGPGATAARRALISSCDAARRRASPGTRARDDRRVRVEQPCATRREVDERNAELDHRPAQRAGRGPGPHLRGRGRARTIAAARSRSAISARGRPSTNSAGSPSPSCASTLSVPITPLASTRPHVRVFVRAARAAEHARSSPGRGGPRALRDRVGRGGRARRATTPRRSSPSSRTMRLEERLLGVHPLEAVATLVAEPAVVDRLGVDAEQAHEPVRRRLHRAAALHRARRARRLDRRRGPRAGPGSGTGSR